jgi:hypothetical protein
MTAGRHGDLEPVDEFHTEDQWQLVVVAEASAD